MKDDFNAKNENEVDYTQQLLSQLRKLEKSNPSFRYYIDNTYTATQMIAEIENKSALGLKTVEDFTNSCKALDFFKENGFHLDKYNVAASELSSMLREIANDYPGVWIAGTKNLSPLELITEIENKTPTGIAHVKGYILAEQRHTKKQNKNKPG